MSFGVFPKIILENRTSHVISSGESIGKFWSSLQNRGFSEKGYFIKIILDIQQLFTDSRNKGVKFKQSLYKIPPESIAGFHIHQKHRNPNLEGEINWKTVRNYIHDNLQEFTLLVLPEVHHSKQLEKTYEFCKSFLKL